jgi:hypothetical protein
MERRKYKRLTAAEVKKLATQPGLHADGDGLHLSVSPTGAASWVWRYLVQVGPPKKQRDMGLGPLRHVSLAEARQKAEEARELKRSGIDPLDARRTKQIADDRANAPHLHLPEPWAGPLSVEQIRRLPDPERVSGIYFLFEGDTLQYAGQSDDVYQRVRDHRKKRKIPFDNWRFVVVAIADLDAVEALYIRALKPSYNRRRRRQSRPPAGR